ncbi:hypothetical protein FPOAC1_003458 [Fusarium poae]|uniref:hypothetical protein n=1 Tax=Fusarium poae TaxID=36050 RepID=UPI001CE74C3E|nr:hypothetical protein FPOAC1_003458 [Fusarium poae]KAG8677440.1 hypothetical protein FPOAC1_003458 [Fusarium poae]
MYDKKRVPSAEALAAAMKGKWNAEAFSKLSCFDQADCYYLQNWPLFIQFQKDVVHTKPGGFYAYSDIRKWLVAVAIPNLDTTGDQREYGALSATGITRTQHELEKEMNRDAITRHDCAGTNETGEINGCGTVTHSRLCRSLRSDCSGPASELPQPQDEIIQHLFIVFVTYLLAQQRLPLSSLPQNRHIPRASWLTAKDAPTFPARSTRASPAHRCWIYH